MKMFLKFASIPLALVLILIGLPRLFAMLINAHSDLGIVVLVTIVCGIFGFVINKFYKLSLEKENENEV